MNDVLPGLRLRGGRYLLVAALREGGTATIWRAVDTRERAERALKAIPVALDGARVAELEAEVSARVEHAGIVPVLASFVEAGHAWVVMELAAGSLADAVEAHGPLDGAELRGVARALGAAVAAAHAVGVVHRDIKPQNVLLHADGRVQLSDFGIAQVYASGQTRTRTGAVLGTLPFMAPEQRRDARAVRPATDVYALAVLLAWARTGVTPGELYVPAAAERLRSALRDAGEADDALFTLLVACSAYEAGDRPADGAAFLTRVEALPGEAAVDLRALADRLGPAEERASGGAGASVGGGSEGRGAASEGSRGGRRARPAVMGAGAAAAAVLLVAGAFGAGTRYAVAPSPPGELPLCPSVWRPTSAARMLGPRETVGVVADDLDGDGRSDAVFANQLDESLSIYWGDGTARLGSPDTLPVGRVSAAPAVGDVDGDGRADLLVPDADKSELRVYRQEAARRFVESGRVEHADLSPIGAPALVNWNGDGVADLAVVAEGGVKVRLGLGGGAFSTDQLNAELGPRPFAVVRRAGAVDALLVGGSDGADLVEPGPGGVARRTRHWSEFGQPMTAGSGPDLLLRRSAALVQLLPDGATCVRGPAAGFEDVFALSDMDGDGTPEGLGVSSCAGCTSNHVVVSGG